MANLDRLYGPYDLPGVNKLVRLNIMTKHSLSN